MSQDNKVGIAKVSFRDKEHLAALRFTGRCFRPGDHVLARRDPPGGLGGVDVSAKVRDQELEMADS